MVGNLLGSIARSGRGEGEGEGGSGEVGVGCTANHHVQSRHVERLSLDRRKEGRKE